MPSKLRQVLPHSVMLAASVLLYWAAMRIEPGTGGRIGPGVWPKAIIVIMGLLCAYEIAKRLVVSSRFTAKGLIDGLNQSPAESLAAADAAPPVEPQHPRKLYWGIGLVAAYVLLVPWAGFFLSTAIFLAIFPLAGGLWRPAMSAVLGVAGSLVLVVIFMRVAYISLPLGEGPFRALSLALMRLLGVT